MHEMAVIRRVEHLFSECSIYVFIFYFFLLLAPFTNMSKMGCGKKVFVVNPLGLLLKMFTGLTFSLKLNY